VVFTKQYYLGSPERFDALEQGQRFGLLAPIACVRDRHLTLRSPQAVEHRYQVAQASDQPVKFQTTSVSPGGV
jgi:hypothetical protein